jgi:hypothetical protein
VSVLSTPKEYFDSVRPGRVAAVAGFGFIERQARFLVTVMVHSGVFLERQYCTFAGISHGQKSHWRTPGTDSVRRGCDRWVFPQPI